METKVARQPEGGAFTSRGVHYARVTISPKKREAIACRWAPSREDALTRAKAIQGLVNRLLESGHADLIANLIASAGTADDAKMAALARGVDGICGGTVPVPVKATRPGTAGTVPTFKEWREKWTTGELAKLYPSVVDAKRTSDVDKYRAIKHVEPVVGKVLVREITLEHFEEVMRRIPSELSDATRLHIAQVMRRVLDLAVYPGKYITSNPIPKTAMPKVRKQKLGRWLYPSEDAKLLGAPSVDLGRRLLFGFMTRLGWRKGEAIGGTLDGKKTAPRSAAAMERDRP
jgi:hypothetical protein